MSYKVWTPVDGVTKAALVYNMSRCGTVYCSPCAGRNRDDCYADKDLYKVCPGCGGKLPESIRTYECSCGTAMWVCGNQHHRFVHAYVTPHPMFLVEEDII